MDYIKLARAVGFAEAGIMKVDDLVIRPEFRKLCEENTCGNYNVAEGCPPLCGELEDMLARMNRYEHALILKTKTPCNPYYDRKEQNEIQARQNKLTLVLHDLIKQDGVEDMLVMTAGPYGHFSCLSAYCIHAQKMADHVGMTCWKKDGHARYFSLILY